MRRKGRSGGEGGRGETEKQLDDGDEEKDPICLREPYTFASGRTHRVGGLVGGPRRAVGRSSQLERLPRPLSSLGLSV